MGGSLLRRRAFRLFGSLGNRPSSGDPIWCVSSQEFAELVTTALICTDGPSRGLDRRQIDFEKADFQEVTFGVGYDCWCVAASHLR